MAILIRKRGVSEVIASLMILLIISILGTSIYNVSLTVMHRKNTNLQYSMKVNSERANERWKVLLVEWNGYDDLLNVSMYNFGKINLNIVDVYVNGFRVESYQSLFPVALASSKVGEVSFYSPTAVYDDEFYEIIIVSQRGVSCVYHWES